MHIAPMELLHPAQDQAMGVNERSSEARDVGFDMAFSPNDLQRFRIKSPVNLVGIELHCAHCLCTSSLSGQRCPWIYTVPSLNMRLSSSSPNRASAQLNGLSIAVALTEIFRSISLTDRSNSPAIIAFLSFGRRAYRSHTGCVSFAIESPNE